mgnify:CR=1 FL=1
MCYKLLKHVFCLFVMSSCKIRNLELNFVSDVIICMVPFHVLYHAITWHMICYISSENVHSFHIDCFKYVASHVIQQALPWYIMLSVTCNVLISCVIIYYVLCHWVSLFHTLSAFFQISISVSDSRCYSHRILILLFTYNNQRFLQFKYQTGCLKEKLMNLNM